MTGKHLTPYTPQKSAPPVVVMRSDAVIVKIWENISNNGTYLNATIERFYKDKESGETRLGSGPIN